MTEPYPAPDPLPAPDPTEPTPVVEEPAGTGEVPPGYSTYTGAPYDKNPTRLYPPVPVAPGDVDAATV